MGATTKAKGATERPDKHAAGEARPLARAAPVAALAEAAGLDPRAVSAALGALERAVAWDLDRRGAADDPGPERSRAARKPASPERQGNNPHTRGP